MEGAQQKDRGRQCEFRLPSRLELGATELTSLPCPPIPHAPGGVFYCYPGSCLLRSSSWFLTHVTDMPQTLPISNCFFPFWWVAVCVSLPLGDMDPMKQKCCHNLHSNGTKDAATNPPPLLFLSFVQLPSRAFCLYFPLLVDSLITRRRVEVGAGKKHLNKADCKADVAWLCWWWQGILPPEPNFDHKL